MNGKIGVNQTIVLIPSSCKVFNISTRLLVTATLGSIFLHKVSEAVVKVTCIITLLLLFIFLLNPNL